MSYYQNLKILLSLYPIYLKDDKHMLLKGEGPQTAIKVSSEGYGIVCYIIS
jgi:hypothetical protein